MTALPKLEPMAIAFIVFLDIAPGERQSVGPDPPTCMGPFAHISPSELLTDAKKGKPSGKETVQEIESIDLEVKFSGGCKLEAIVKVKGGIPDFGVKTTSVH